MKILITKSLVLLAMTLLIACMGEDMGSDTNSHDAYTNYCVILDSDSTNSSAPYNMGDNNLLTTRLANSLDAYRPPNSSDRVMYTKVYITEPMVTVEVILEDDNAINGDIIYFVQKLSIQKAEFFRYQDNIVNHMVHRLQYPRYSARRSFRECDPQFWEITS
ncbi:MAG: hypothetical protein LBV04_00410 [Deferribacteraceae bacterium]|jgi:hypothetical protein|nr:hypothetical protein [Deferribacteraceae bacterium]